MTRFRALLQYVDDYDEDDKKEAILKYFSDEDNDQFEIADETFYVMTKHEVEDLLKEQYKEDCKDFHNSIGYSVQNAYIKEYIDYETIVMDLVDSFCYDELVDYDFHDQVDGYYIYQDKQY